MNGEIQFVGKTKRNFWNVKRELVDTSNTPIASYLIKQKPLVPYCDLLIILVLLMDY